MNTGGAPVPLLIHCMLTSDASGIGIRMRTTCKCLQYLVRVDDVDADIMRDHLIKTEYISCFPRESDI